LGGEKKENTKMRAINAVVISVVLVGLMLGTVVKAEPPDPVVRDNPAVIGGGEAVEMFKDKYGRIIRVLEKLGEIYNGEEVKKNAGSLIPAPAQAQILAQADINQDGILNIQDLVANNQARRFDRADLAFIGQFLRTEDLSVSYDYTVDAQGTKVLESFTISRKNADGSSIATTFGSDGNLSKITRTDKDGVTVVEYNQWKKYYEKN
jgi:hypothetical protein